jgi:hypothetical protein
MMRSRTVSALLVLAALVWGGTVVAAYRAIRRFETTPGEAAASRQMWPAATHVPRSAGRWSLVMLVHPHCSCSRASVEELAAIVERAPRDIDTTVVVYRPHEMPAGWERTEVYDAATRIHRAHVIVDDDGAEAAAFGGFTSGQTFLYDGEGRLRFAGGITSLRGHTGMNGGSAEVLRIASRRAGSGGHPVFGCAIATKNEGGTR